MYCEIITISLDQRPPTFLATGTNFVEGNFSKDCLDDSVALHLLCTLFLSLLYQLNLRSLDIRSWRLGTPALDNIHHYIITFLFLLVMRTCKIDCLSSYQTHNPLQYSCLEVPLVGYSPWGHREPDTT